MFLNSPLLGTELSGKHIHYSAEQVSTSYGSDNAQITSAAVDGEILGKMGD